VLMIMLRGPDFYGRIARFQALRADFDLNRQSQYYRGIDRLAHEFRQKLVSECGFEGRSSVPF